MIVSNALSQKTEKKLCIFFCGCNSLHRRTKLPTPVSVWRIIFFLLFLGVQSQNLGFSCSGVSTSTKFSKVLISMWEIGSLVQYDSVVSVGPNIWELHLGSLFWHISTAGFGKSFQMLTSSIPGAQQNIRHDYIKTVVNNKWHLL